MRRARDDLPYLLQRLGPRCADALWQAEELKARSD